ncbi:MAG TPA: hypothetical protein ENK99_02810, partial [Campylobacterales bacterium]|nr:hypothetical protein [Campylobacterales bacterium]
YELAIMLPKKDDDAMNIVALSIVISFFVSFITLLIVFSFNAQITHLLGNPEISFWLYFIPITVLLTGVYQSFNYWINRKKEYGRLATNKVIQSGTTAMVNLGMGFGGFGSSGLILGRMLGQGIATGILAKVVWQERRGKLKSIDKLKVLALAIRYKKMPVFNLPNALIDGFRLSGINILIAKFFMISTLGQFSLAWKIVQVPLSLIASSLTQVFFQKISSIPKQDIHVLIKNYIFKSTLISFPLFLGIYFFAVDFFTLIFGKEWKLAGEAASVMSPWLFLNFLTAPVANIFIVLDRQEIVLFVSILYMAVPIVILVFLHQRGFLCTLEFITVSMSLVLMIYIGLALFYTKKEGRG